MRVWSPDSVTLVVDVSNKAEQWLLSLSLWGQAPLVIPIVVLVSVGVAWAVVHIVDKVGIPIESAIEEHNRTVRGHRMEEES